MKTPLLLDVPKTGPSLSERMTAFKRKHGIDTHCAGKSSDDFPSWLAAHMPSCHKLGYGVDSTSDLFECSIKVGRLMDEGGLCAYGKGELSAIRRLCAQLNIECDL